jgi:hypothetical protein
MFNHYCIVHIKPFLPESTRVKPLSGLSDAPLKVRLLALLARQERLVRDKHSTLLQSLINYRHKVIKH